MQFVENYFMSSLMTHWAKICEISMNNLFKATFLCRYIKEIPLWADLSKSVAKGLFSLNFFRYCPDQIFT